MITYTCDKCKKSYTEGIFEDIFELQEFLHISFTGGYCSVFGDGEIIKLDICQRCLYTMIKDLLPNKEHGPEPDYMHQPPNIKTSYTDIDY